MITSILSNSYELISLLFFLLSGFLFLLTLFLRMWNYFPPLTEKGTKKTPEISLTSSLTEDLHPSPTPISPSPVENSSSVGYTYDVASQPTESVSTNTSVTEDSPTGFLPKTSVTEDSPTGFLPNDVNQVIHTSPAPVTEETFQSVLVLQFYTPES